MGRQRRRRLSGALVTVPKRPAHKLASRMETTAVERIRWIAVRVVELEAVGEGDIGDLDEVLGALRVGPHPPRTSKI